jgi:hypothetical protein
MVSRMESTSRQRNLRTVLILLIILTSIFSLSALASPVYVHALSHSIQVAYVTDFYPMQVCSTSTLSTSIFVSAITGSPPVGCPSSAHPTYTTVGGNTVTFTDVTVAAIDAGGLAAISGFDTVLLYEVCDIGNPSHSITMTALNNYLTAGNGKVVIYDSDRCSGNNPATPIPHYNTFLYPFTTSNPGPVGHSLAPTWIETESPPAVLTRALPGISTTNPINDAIGDSNTFVTYDPAWCAAERGPNENGAGVGVTGIQIAYARTPAGGLVIYDGNDNWWTDGPNAWDRQVFDNILDQPFNLDSLPCGSVATGITVTPGTATNPVGSSHTVTATVLDNAGAPLVGVTVTFKVTSGPNVGQTGTCVTNSAGQCTFTYSDTGGAGTDNIVATFTDATGTLHSSNIVTKTWQTTITTIAPCVNVTNLSTGLDIHYNPLPYLTTDAHWTVVLPSGVTDYPDSINAAGAWYNGPSPIHVGPGGQADWITPHGGHDASGYPLNLPGGTYDYSIHFHVYTPSTLVIDGYAADNGVKLLIDPHPPLLPSVLGPPTTITGPGGSFTGLLVQPVQPNTAPPPFNPTIPSPQTFNLITPGDYSLHAFVDNSPATFTGVLVVARLECGCFTDVTTTVTYPKVTAAASTVTNTTLVSTTCCTSSTTITGTSINPGADFKTTWTSTSCVSCTSLTTITGTSTLNLPFVSKTTWTNTTCLGGGCTTTSTVTHIVPYSPPWTNVGLIQWLVVIAGLVMAGSYILSKQRLLRRSRASPKAES